MAKAQIDKKLELDQNFDETVKLVNIIAKKLGPKFIVSLEDKVEQLSLPKSEQNYFSKLDPIITLQYLTPMGGQFIKLKDEDIAFPLDVLGKDLTRAFEDEFIVGKSHVRLELPYEDAERILANTEWHSHIIAAAVKKYESTVTARASKKSGQSHVEKVTESATDKMIGLSGLR